MKQNVMLSIRGQQDYPGQEPEVIELMTEGVMEQTEDGWTLTYQESDLTGMTGVTTTFLLQPGVITLQRTGALTSQMVFQEGVTHESLYQMEFGALLIAVRAQRVEYELTRQGGKVEVDYAIEIEQNMAGLVRYHLTVRPK